MVCSESVHKYVAVSFYICTFPTSCMYQSVFDKSEPATKSILTTHQSEARLATAEHITLDDTSLALIS